LGRYGANMGCEVTLEEAVNVPMPKSEEFEWGRIVSREVRFVIADLRSEQFLSNVHIVNAGWKAEMPTKWLFNVNEVQAAGR
jgi:hypothetical protein